MVTRKRQEDTQPVSSDTDCSSVEMKRLLQSLKEEWRKTPQYPTFEDYASEVKHMLAGAPEEVFGLLADQVWYFSQVPTPTALQKMAVSAILIRTDLKDQLGMNIDQPTEPPQKRKRTRFNRVRLYDNRKPLPPEPAPTPTPTRELTEFPANWELGRTEIRVAHEIAGWDEYKADEQFTKFRRWAVNKGATSAEWPQVWRTWCSNGKQYEAQRAKRGFR